MFKECSKLNARLNKDTQFCISIASNPSNFGTLLHNAVYAKLGLNFAYKAFCVSDIQNVIAGVRALGIRGCSVSMPFKENIIPYLDALDESAKVIGAVNTVVNNNGNLTGYNTDALGAEIALNTVTMNRDEPVLLLGAGGVSRAILFALKKLGFTKIRIANRDIEKIHKMQVISPCEKVAWNDRHTQPAKLIINATPIGMSTLINEIPIEESFLQNCETVMDLVVFPVETRLIKAVRNVKKNVIPGHVMSLEQTMAQFMLYTNQPAPYKVMQDVLQQLLAGQENN